MKIRTILMALAALLALVACSQKPKNTFDWDNNDKIEYVVDYTVGFTSDHDSTMQLTAFCNYGNVEIAQVESENLIGEDGKPVKNTFIVLEASVPAGKGITLQRGGLSYTGGKPEFVHNHTVGSNDMVELRIMDTNAFTHSRTNAFSTTLYSIRDNMFYDPYDAQSFTIPGGQRFSVVLPIITKEMYPKFTEKHSIRIRFEK